MAAMEAEVRYWMLRPRQIVERRSACPAAYVPLGTLEWQGLHNPVGADTLQAEGLAVLCARKGGGVVFPPLYYGENRLESLMEANAKGRDGSPRRSAWIREPSARLGIPTRPLNRPRRQPPPYPYPRRSGEPGLRCGRVPGRGVPPGGPRSAAAVHQWNRTHWRATRHVRRCASTSCSSRTATPRPATTPRGGDLAHARPAPWDRGPGRAPPQGREARGRRRHHRSPGRQRGVRSEEYWTKAAEAIVREVNATRLEHPDTYKAHGMCLREGRAQGMNLDLAAIRPAETCAPLKLPPSSPARNEPDRRPHRHQEGRGRRSGAPVDAGLPSRAPAQGGLRTQGRAVSGDPPSGAVLRGPGLCLAQPARAGDRAP